MEQIQALVLNPLKPLVLPITTNLPGPINDVVISLLGAPCHSALLLDLDIVSHPECVSLAISKALGIAIITAASIVKVPQIIKLVRSQSAEGLSITSYVLETVSYLVTLAYNIRSGFPFSTYGETSFILVQNVIIAVLILTYSGKGPIAGAFVAALGSAVYALMVNDTLVSSEQMTTLQAGAGVLSIASKLPQIFAVYAQGGTGQLSAFAVFNYLAGSLSRIFTTLQEVDDKLILYGFIAGFVLNAILAGQMVYYWNSPTTAGHGTEVKTNEKLAIKGVGQSGAQGLATEENLKKAGIPIGTSPPRPSSSSGRRRA
jgi:mannose-P-dolichol utilization defect 1